MYEYVRACVVIIELKMEAEAMLLGSDDRGPHTPHPCSSLHCLHLAAAAAAEACCDALDDAAS